MMSLFEKFPPRKRIALGLVGMMVSTLLIADSAGSLSSRRRDLAGDRLLLCEWLASSCSALASASQMEAIPETFNSLVESDPSLQSICLLLADGETSVNVESSAFQRDQLIDKNAHSLLIPVYRDGVHWGDLQVCFAATPPVFSRSGWAVPWLFILIIPICFLQFDFFLSKTLRQFDPSGRMLKAT
ncbi:MAG: hypothetical protein P8L85_21505 [Rubripirellula sp.]|nr:hypothetical protein [Rubripirellula sp.]